MANRKWGIADGEWGEEKPQGQIDYVLFSLVVALVMVGVVMVGASTYHRGFHYVRSHILKVILGFFTMWVGTKLNFFRLARPRVRMVMLLSTLVVLTITVVCGELVGVTRRNLFGAFQPAEFAKFVVVIWLSGYFSELYSSGKRVGFVNSMVIPGSVVAGVVMLVLLQPAVGTSLLIALSSAAVFVIAGVRARYLLTAAIVVGLLLGGAVMAMPFLRGSRYNYIAERWDRFRRGDRYHQHQALVALGSGGLLGRGLGEGRQKYYFLPKLQTDFIFCAIGEERGFLGSFGIMILYLLFFWRCMRIARRTTSEFGSFLAGGIGVVIMLYALVHQAVALSIIPCTGQPLPFVSYGGSALVSNLFATGVVLKISKYRRGGVEEGFNMRGWNRRPHLSGTRPRV